MSEKKIPFAEIIGVPSFTESVKQLPIGEPRMFKNSDFKVSTARQTITKLRKLGWEIDITEEGMVMEYMITVNKRPDGDA